MIEKGSGLETGFGELSVAVTVKVNVPAAAGVPPRDPALARLSPGGRLPAVMLQVSGGVPPEVLKLKGP